MKKRKTALILVFFIFWNMIGYSLEGEYSAAVKRLSIKEVSRLALENSLDIQIAKYDAYIKRTDLGKEESIFDTFLTTEISYNKDKTKSTSSLAATETATRAYSLELEKKLPTGTTLTIGAVSGKTKSNSSTVTVNPAREASGKVSIVQELGKNFFGLADRGEIKITKIEIENSEITSLDDIEEELYEIQKAYWKFVLKDKELRIAEDMLAEAKKLYTIYRQKFAIGLAERVDLLAMEANVKVRENGALSGRLAKDTSKNELLFLLNEPDLSIIVEPLDSLRVSPTFVNLPISLRESIKNRRDYKKVKNELKAKGIDIVIKKNALWPQIDLEASYLRNGIDSNLRESIRGITAEDNPETYFGLTVKFSLENREAKADFESVSLEKAQLLLEFKKTERAILKEVNNRVKEVNILKGKVEALSEIAGLQKEKLKEEKKRLRYGRSGSDTVIRYEDDLLEARLDYAKALYDYRVSLAGLELDKNTLLDKYWEGEL